MADPFRVYGPEECGQDGYPFIWHRNDGSLDALIAELEIAETSGVKHIVRAQAAHRCLRCNHPFVVGESGVMEGPQAEAKSWAAEMGVDVEVLDEVFADIGVPGLTREQEMKALERARRINWSRCDKLCTHGGPIRAAWENKETGETEKGDTWSPTSVATAGELHQEWLGKGRIEAAWRILTVHHLDEVKANLRWWNLVALCQRCHLLIQRKVTMDHPWPWEHSDWFRPYAAAWYALKYRGEELNRLETLGRLEELLALGQREESVERMPL